MTTSTQIRDALVDALRFDLIGPDPDEHGTFFAEKLPTAPSKWYLSGFLVPFEARDPADDRITERIDEVSGDKAGDDNSAPEEQATARKAWFPSSMGMSLLVAPDTATLQLTAHWGDYVPFTEPGKEDADEDDEESPRGAQFRPWYRSPQQHHLTLRLADLSERTTETAIPGTGGMVIATACRVVSADSVPPGTRSISIFLVNKRASVTDALKDESYVFQATLQVDSDIPFIPRPNRRGQGESSDWDERVADLQYRDCVEYAVGHNVSVTATTREDACFSVRTSWIPSAEVEKTIATDIKNVELTMETLAGATSAGSVRGMVGGLVSEYADWIARQVIPADTGRAQTAEALLTRARVAQRRIDAGINALSDPDALLAFQITNRAISTAIRQRSCHNSDESPDSISAPKWRPFQLAFLLMNLPGVLDPTHADRKIVDLLFFPTGGGKTEAYLGLAAFTMVLRRLRNPGLTGAGVSVLMRYTLRLLTLDQLGRAATLICALELERLADETTRLGTWPFEIGLWVGQSATPNRMGRKGDRKDYTARKKTIDFQNAPKVKPSPIPLEDCPWCGTKFTKNSFKLHPNADTPTDLRVRCAKRRCTFSGRYLSLPIVSVDEPLYRRLPSFLIATVDKFANLPWVGETGALFGKVDRFDGEGFYGPNTPGRGQPLSGGLLPPDLIIQDELHLISGPLGTMVGLYETVIDELCVRTVNDKAVRPKVVASTATVRRASRQIQALFQRDDVDVFPPPGPDRRNSFFAKTVSSDEQSARRYIGIAAQGRSLKVVLLRAYLALMAAAQKHWIAAGGNKNPNNPADPYMSLLGYFSSLRELGGTRRIVEDEVSSRLLAYGKRMREDVTEGDFARREVKSEIRELTSRVSTNQIAETKRRLSLPFHDKERVDVALATNMISVGLDITRLGLMVVLGQPKTASEYIQATSRVGRKSSLPGLVVTLLNIHRPRDRSHYERFEVWHRSFYRFVEATSVTPFSPRAIDRGLAGVAVALARHGDPKFTAPSRAVQMANHRAGADFVADALSRRAEGHDPDLDAVASEALRTKIRDRTSRLLDDWERIAKAQNKERAGLQYQREDAGKGDPPLLYTPTDPELKKLSPIRQQFKAQRSLRDVEPNVNLWVKTLDGQIIEGDT